MGKDVFVTALTREIERAQAMNDACSVVFLKLDQSADISSRLGDERLASIHTEIASLVNDFLKEGTDRGGHCGDGLAVMLPRTPSRIARNLADQISRTVSHLNFPDLNGASTLSIGIAACPEHGAEAQGVLDRAREACAQVASGGGNSIKVFEA